MSPEEQFEADAAHAKVCNRVAEQRDDALATLRATLNELHAVRENLKATQTRCTELLEECRRLKAPGSSLGIKVVESLAVPPSEVWLTDGQGNGVRLQIL